MAQMVWPEQADQLGKRAEDLQLGLLGRQLVAELGEEEGKRGHQVAGEEALHRL